MSSPSSSNPHKSFATGERIAKIIARSGACSRRDAERWIEEKRVQVNGKLISSPALNIHKDDIILIDGKPIAARERTRLWLYHKPSGLVVSHRDEKGRSTLFDALPKNLPRVQAVGRLDLNTEGLLLLTNDGGLKRVLELPATGWVRRYRVRAFVERGLDITQNDFDPLEQGISINGVHYGAIYARIQRVQESHIWVNVDLREGKNREIKRVFEHLGLKVARLIRISYGPFQLKDLPKGELFEVRPALLKEQLGKRLCEQAGVDFDAPLRSDTKRAGQRQHKDEMLKGENTPKKGTPIPNAFTRARQRRAQKKKSLNDQEFLEHHEKKRKIKKSHPSSSLLSQKKAFSKKSPSNRPTLHLKPHKKKS